MPDSTVTQCDRVATTLVAPLGARKRLGQVRLTAPVCGLLGSLLTAQPFLMLRSGAPAQDQGIPCCYHVVESDGVYVLRTRKATWESWGRHWA